MITCSLLISRVKYVVGLSCAQPQFSVCTAIVIYMECKHVCAVCVHADSLDNTKTLLRVNTVSVLTANLSLPPSQYMLGSRCLEVLFFSLFFVACWMNLWLIF